MPPVKGILETALFVQDVKRAVEFYCRIFGFEVIASSERLHALAVAPQQVLLLFKQGASIERVSHEGGFLPGGIDTTGPDHLTFAIAAEDFDAWERWLGQNGLAIELRKQWELGGRSLYFRDPDGHLLELATPGVWQNY
ncbi:MAG TPA: VOC family protein [Candidatus Xenobia bacterium]|nr:VOC family protein [Candidatus Xenobia bacterium]